MQIYMYRRRGDAKFSQGANPLPEYVTVGRDAHPTLNGRCSQTVLISPRLSR